MEKLKIIFLFRNSRADGILCPYQLMGSCQDADCQYVHHTPSH